MIRRPPRSTRTDTLFPTRRSSDLILITQDSSVGIYFAEVVQARTQGTTTSLYDLSSVQVLKGPQGTLFGRNFTGGAILFSPQKPEDEFKGYIQVGYGKIGRAHV